MTSILFSWLGKEDLRPEALDNRGPLEQVLLAGRHDELHLLSVHARSRTSEFAERIQSRSSVGVVQHFVELPEGEDLSFDQAYAAARSAVDAVLGRRPDARTTFHLSSGTPAMVAPWMILARTRCLANLVQYTKARGVHRAEVPLDVSAEYVVSAGNALSGIAARPGNAALGDPDQYDHVMAQVLRRAERVAGSDIAVLLESEPGVEAETFARFIHERSRRAGGRFVSFPCRATPEGRLEADLFGQSARPFGAPFEGQPGLFEVARGATLFLDEITAISLEGQIRLSRILSTGEVMRINGHSATAVDVRIVAGTRRDLAREVAEGRFLEDLYKQLFIAAIRLPSIRDRKAELPALLDRLLVETNARCSAMTPKRLSPEARNALLARSWPGNVTELRNALTRLVVWAERETISASDVRQHLQTEDEAHREEGVLGRALDDSFRMEELLDEVSRSYIERALDESGGVKAKAVELLGMSNATTLTNWMKRLGIDGGAKR